MSSNELKSSNQFGSTVTIESVISDSAAQDDVFNVRPRLAGYEGDDDDESDICRTQQQQQQDQQRRQQQQTENDAAGKVDSCCSEVLDWGRGFASRSFSKKQLYRKVPILEWLPKYDVSKGVSDLIAGLTVGLTVIPQGIAYALVAELPPQYGLYSAFMGCFVYCLFGSCKSITIGPTAIMALMTAEYAKGKSPDLVLLLTFLTGVIIGILGLLRLGFVIDFISIPVIAGFTSAAAITIMSSQVMGLFGLTMSGTESSDVVGITGTWINIVNCFDTIRYQDAILGCCCIVLLLLMRKLNQRKWFSAPSAVDCDDAAAPPPAQLLSPLCRRILSKTIWIILTGRNALIVVVCIVIAYACNPELPEDPKSRNTTFILTGKIEGGLPGFNLPPFSTEIDGETLDFGDMVKELGYDAVIIIPLIALLENIAIAKAFACGKPVDANQEMLALGLCNFLGAFVGSMPTTGSFSRTAVNASSGVQTTFGGIYTGAFVILALLFLMPACAYIPKATLAAVIISAVVFSVEYHVVRPMYKSKKSDLFCAFATFLCCLFWALEYGILVGAAIQACFVLYYSARPNMYAEQKQLGEPGTEFMLIRVDRALLFPSVSYIRNLINKVGLRQGSGRVPVVVDLQHVCTTDFTGAAGLAAMADDFKHRDQIVLFVNAQPNVEASLLGPGELDSTIFLSSWELRKRLEALFLQAKESGSVDKGISHYVEDERALS